ncbi:MAG: Crp/Fnr family transcriptional regulator [Flavobacteriales bacterium]|nr:Crp/Fnr family transcriptional regulator [Flavobacteriales bacterium]
MIAKNLLIEYGAVLNEYRTGHVIIREGEHCAGYFQLVSGSVNWTNLEGKNKETLHDIIMPEECFGETSLFDHLTYTSSFIADEPCRVYHLETKDFHRLLHDNPEITHDFLKLLSTRITYRNLLFRELASQSPSHRIKTLLDYLRNTGKSFCPRMQKVTMTRRQIAGMTGLRVETVIRAIRKMNASGEITIEHGKIYLKSNERVFQTEFV